MRADLDTIAAAADARVDAGRANDTARRADYLALALMYVAQGLPIGLAYHALAVLIRAGGHDAAAVGYTGLAFVPWALKFLWAPAIDNACERHGLPRVLWTTQIMIVAVCAALVPFPPAVSLPASLTLVVLMNALCATQDIVTNAYAVRTMQGRAAGAANAIQVAGFIVGMLAGGGGLLVLSAQAGWTFAMTAFAIAMALIDLPLLFVDTGFAKRGIADAGPAAPRVRLRDVVSGRDFGWAMLLASTFKLASTATSTLVQPWLIDRGLSLDEIGRLQMSNLCCVALGAVALGMPLVRRLGCRRAVKVGIVGAGVSLGAAWMLETRGMFSLLHCHVAFAVQSLFEGAMYVAIWATLMNWASPARPGADFTAMQCCESVGSAVATGAIGMAVATLGYGAAFACAWGLAVPVWGAAFVSVRRIRLHEAGGRPDRV
ncbi:MULTISPECIES: MFS transporter [Burkholderia]|uniref:Major facilitator superfamily protein n=1 Tax=Burkholderia paludis TaxID=1506587 RepID=A0A6J5DJG3_9BURK|nr:MULTISPECIES: MFS transporter [Burkholderia]CAB3753036.1 Anhydromuropeptide permease [Burkholderia paludis]VWB64974.1 major facilitator superfamily protein [Burkholderia paludis]